MPEGDSVWRLARRLDRQLAGATITRCQFRVPQLATADLTGRTVVGHATHGKHLLARFSGGLTLHSQLLMDGEWSLTGPGRRLPPHLAAEIRVVLGLADARTLWGLRMHGLRLVPTAQESTVIGHLGPDLLHDDVDTDEAVRRLRARPDRPLVAALLDQRSLAGLGNLWVNELAFLIGVDPWTPIGEVDVEALVDRAVTTLRRSAMVEGAYQVTTGRRARGETHWVVGRAGRPCLRCRAPIAVKAEVGGDPERRRTWWCPRCQPRPGSATTSGARPQADRARSAAPTAPARPPA